MGGLAFVRDCAFWGLAGTAFFVDRVVGGDLCGQAGVRRCEFFGILFVGIRIFLCFCAAG
jgi:hypothetical protein